MIPNVPGPTHRLPPRRGLGRRDFLSGLATASLAARVAPGQETNPDAEQSSPGLISRQRRPANLEMPFASLRDFHTPNDRFYVRTHFEVPEIRRESWRLAVEGEVQNPFELDWDGLRAMPSRTLSSLLECSGNGRVFLDPPQTSIRWELGAVGNAEWTGVPLAAVLERAGVKDTAVEVILEGADSGTFEAPQPPTPGAIPYARSLPMEKARSPEVLLAYRMNGEDLPPRHGHPVRAVVPGWYGMASVKWLRRIIVADRPFHGYFQTMAYAIWEHRHGMPSLVPVTEIQVKAEIARPAPFEVVPAGEPYRVFGAAWAGEARVEAVEFSADEGASWSEATLLGDPVPFAWQFWECEWRAPARPGPLVLMARATDDRGRTQPEGRDPYRRDAVITHVLPIPVEIR